MNENQISALIYATASLDGMPDTLARLIVAQARHESDDFTSNAFIKNNNCFGYKYVPGGRWQIGAGITSTEKDPYAKYKDIESSVHELTGWIKRRMIGKKFPSDLNEIKTPLQYATYLKACGYYGDTLQHYEQGLTHFLNS
jgi:uncharacterized FlgJ-related protein